MKVMALDFGSARTGVAVSDPTGVIARPLCVVQRAASETGLDELVRLVRGRGAGAGRRRPSVDAPRRARRAGARDARTSPKKLRERLEVPVLLFDERFTTDLAQQTPSAPPRMRARPRTSCPATSRGRAPPRRDAAEAGAAAPAGVARRDPAPPARRARRRRARGAHRLRAREDRRGDSVATPPPSTAASSQPKPFRIVFPEGFTRAEMAQRVEAVAKIARAQAHTSPCACRSGRTSRDRGRASSPASVEEARPRRLPLPGDVRLPRRRRRRAQLVQDQLDAFAKNWRKVDLAYARKKNLTPYDVLIIASLVEKESARSGRAAEDRARHLQPPARAA